MEERICWRAKSEWNNERVREDASGDSEDGKDDELPCVIGESACVWRGSRRSVECRIRMSIFPLQFPTILICIHISIDFKIKFPFLPIPSIRNSNDSPDHCTFHTHSTTLNTRYWRSGQHIRCNVWGFAIWPHHNGTVQRSVGMFFLNSNFPVRPRSNFLPHSRSAPNHTISIHNIPFQRNSLGSIVAFELCEFQWRRTWSSTTKCTCDWKINSATGKDVADLCV